MTLFKEGAVRRAGLRVPTAAATARTRAAAATTLVVTLAACAAIAAASPPASACDSVNHCHGIATSHDPNGYSGQYAHVRTNCLDLGGVPERVVTNEIWAVTTNGQRWVEAGQGRGVQLGTGPLQAFWGRNDPTLSPAFRSVNLGGVPYNSYNEVMVQRTASNWWIWAAGQWNRTTALTTNVSNMDAGVETNSNYTSSWGSVSNIQLAPPSGSGWIQGLPNGQLIQHFNTRVGWVTYPRWIQMGAGNTTC